MDKEGGGGWEGKRREMAAGWKARSERKRKRERGRGEKGVDAGKRTANSQLLTWVNGLPGNYNATLFRRVGWRSATATLSLLLPASSQLNSCFFFFLFARASLYSNLPSGMKRTVDDVRSISVFETNEVTKDLYSLAEHCRFNNFQK